VIAVPSFVRRSENQLRLDAADKSRDRARKSGQTIRALLVDESELDSPLRADACNAQCSEQLLPPRLGVVFARRESVSAGIHQVRRSAIGGMRDPYVAPKKKVSARADGFIVRVRGEAENARDRERFELEFEFEQMVEAVTRRSYCIIARMRIRPLFLQSVRM